MMMATGPPVSSNPTAVPQVWLSHRRDQAEYSKAGAQPRHNGGMRDLAQVKGYLVFSGTYFVLGLRMTLTNENGSIVGKDAAFGTNFRKL